MPISSKSYQKRTQFLTKANKFNDICKSVHPDHSQDNDCGIITFALMANISYEEAADRLRYEGKEDNKGTPVYALIKAFERMGYEMYEVTSDVLYSEMNHQWKGCAGANNWGEVEADQWFNGYYNRPHLRLMKNPTHTKGGYLDQLKKLYGVTRKFLTPSLADKFPKVKWYEGKEMWLTHGHIFCVDNGVVQDWSNGRSLRVHNIYRIRKIEG